MTLVHDHDRPRRIGMPEAVLCEGKQDGHLVEVVATLAANGAPILLTRLPAERAARLDLASVAERAFQGERGTRRGDGPVLVHDAVSSTAVLHGGLPARAGTVAVVAAGTSDIAVAREVTRTLAFSGVTATEHLDVGVAALWRIMERVDDIRAADVVVVVAGMDAALASVVGGMVGAPVIAVPTSVGYGVAADGTTALHSMLASCAQGVLVTNIDNGFGGACAAVRILGAIHGPGPTS